MALSLSSCRTNPFLTQWNTPYGIPPFDKIEVEDYIPAIQKGIEQQNSQIQAIVDCADTPTFDNTIAPLELSGDILNKVSGVLFNVAESDQTPQLDAVMEQAIPMLTEHSSEMSFNKALYERVAAVYNADQSNLTREQQVVLKHHYDSFVRSGVGLDETKQAELKEIDSKLASLTQKVGNNILAESNAFKDRFGISVSEYPAEMTTCADRDRRKALFEAYSSRGHNGNANDNSAIIVEIFNLRLRKAQILGYDSFAEYELADKMASGPQVVDPFLNDIIKAGVRRARREISDMQAIAGHKIEPWDWWYYAEKVRKAKYDLNDDDIRPYFRIDRVIDGMFACADTLYGIKARKIEGVPSYNEKCVTTYEITDADGSLIGIFTTDPHPRESKRSGAWMNNVRGQYRDADGNDVRPIILNVCNLPEYLTVDDVQTVFHEFGHALHGLLSKCSYASVSGTNVTRDFVEMFSQYNENWAFQPWLLNMYARNDNGEVIPAELVEKINSALQFNQGFMTTELAAASILDMKWHEITSPIVTDDPGAYIDAFESRACREMGLIGEIIPRYRTTYFAHIFSSGYNAGYYGYLWSEVLDKDAFDIVRRACVDAQGNWDMGRTKEMSSKFRQTFLERGGSEEPMTLYRSFAGREPDSHAMLRSRGLLDK